jgi:hypothetical protein
MTYCQILKEEIAIFKLKLGGERGIRTLDTDLSPYASLAGKCLRPLGQLSVFSLFQGRDTTRNPFKNQSMQ